ncbi:MAG: Wzy polymerase domain-containing protein, partial [Ideonella sp.]
LWYAYFLLPTAFAFGICLAGGQPGKAMQVTGTGRSIAPLLVGASALMLVVSLFSVYDYRRVVVIFAPPPNARPLEERIADGEHSIFFAHHAFYAAATTAEDPALAAPWFRIASHFLLDTRFMTAWAKSFAAGGELEKARFLADRLREFQNPASIPFFEVCEKPPIAPAGRPFQCQPAGTVLDFRDFR